MHLQPSMDVRLFGHCDHQQGRQPLGCRWAHEYLAMRRVKALVCGSKASEVIVIRAWLTNLLPLLCVSEIPGDEQQGNHFFRQLWNQTLADVLCSLP